MPKDHYWVLVLCTALLFWYTAQLNCTNGTTVVTCLAVRIEPILGLEHTYYIQTVCIHTCINTLYEYEYEARKNVQINQHSVGAVKNCLSYNVKKKNHKCGEMSLLSWLSLIYSHSCSVFTCSSSHWPQCFQIQSDLWIQRVSNEKKTLCAHLKCSAFWLDSHSFVISCIWTQSSLAQLQHGKNANRVCRFCCFASDASLSNAERLLTTLTATDSEIQVLTLAFYPSTWLAAFGFWLIPPDNHLIAHTYS